MGVRRVSLSLTEEHHADRLDERTAYGKLGAALDRASLRIIAP